MMHSISDIKQGVLKGDFLLLAKAISFIENTVSINLSSQKNILNAYRRIDDNADISFFWTRKSVRTLNESIDGNTF